MRTCNDEDNGNDDDDFGKEDDDYHNGDDDGDLYMIGAVCLSVGHEK